VGRVFALLSALVFLPFHLVVAALIFIEDRLPVFYRSQRLGKDGRPFEMFKYRSMRVGCGMQVDGGFKTVVSPGDERVTRIGRILRRGIDEVPQLINVIRGEMAWIGPRPDELWMLPHYGPAIRERLSVAPGLTGLAQVCDSRNLRTTEAYALEIWAARQRSASLTLKIIAMTPLFIAGWRTIGRSRLQRMQANPEVCGIEQACERELHFRAREAGTF
jgi:undecaprenyl phosphate N,N'-diacetylbacillosamine 1-phosphate transferase